LIYAIFLVTFYEIVIDLHYLWRLQYFRHGWVCWILGLYFYDVFSDSSQTGPLYCGIFSHSSQMNKPFVTFYKIHHGWRTNSPVSMTHLLYFAYVPWIYNVGPTSQICIEKNFFLPKYNIMSPWWPRWHIGIRLGHMSAQLGMKFF
jgi:hypothetical protein